MVTAKEEPEPKKHNKDQGGRNQNKSGGKKKQDEKKGADKKGEDKKKQDEKKGEDKKKQDGKKGGKKKEPEYKPGMPSYMYDPCPHRVWTPKPGERDKSEPRGAGSPWNEPGRKYEDVKNEEEEKSKKKEEKAAKKRQKAHEENQKKKEEEEKKKKEEEKKQKEKEKKKEEDKKKKEKEKKKKEDEKRQKQKEEREKKKKEEEEKNKKEEEDNKKKGDKDGKGKDKEKKKEKKEEPLLASYMYEPCPHKVYNPGPGEKDMADPRGVGSPWYVPTRKKEDIDKEEAEKQEEDNKKRQERSKQHKKEQREKEKKEEKQRKKEEAKQRRKEQLLEERQEQKRKEREERRQEREREEMEKYMGEGVSPNKTDISPELMLLFDFISGVDEEEKEKRGEALQMRKEEIEAEMESHLAKEAFTNDFRTLISTFIEAEWGRADKKLKELKREERRRRREIFKNMDPFAKDMMAEGTRFNSCYKGAMGIKESEKEKRGIGEPSVMEDMVVSRVMEQMDKLMPPEPPMRRSRSMLTTN